jgi:transcriptional regulator with XRE-family HTH domain
MTGLRVALDMTQEQYARAAGVSEREVRDWEAGRVSCPQTWALQRLHALHGTSLPEDLGFRRRSRRRGLPASTVKQGDQTEATVYRRDLVGLVLAAAFNAQHLPALGDLLAEGQTDTRRVGLGDIEQIHKANAGLTSTDLMVGGGAVAVDKLQQQFRTKAALLHGRFASDATRAAAHSAVAHLGSTIGWMLFDQGRHLASRQMYLASMRISKGADDALPLRAVICSEMARQARHCGAFAEASELGRVLEAGQSHSQMMVMVRTAW